MSYWRLLLILTLFLIFLASCQTPKSLNYDQAKNKVDILTRQEKPESAIELLEKMKKQYIEHEYEITRELALLYAKVGSYDKSFEIWNEGHKKAYFYGLFYHFPIYKPFTEYEQFDAISKEDMLLRQAAIKESETIYEVITPQNYNSLKKYPLLIVLHGGGSTIEKEKKYWHSKRLRNEFILVFIQSYLYLDMTSYSWGISDERARTDLKKCYNEIKEEYYVDTNKIIIAGISSGGYTAMDISINNIFPTNGFFVICPDVMANDFNIESIRRAKLSGIKGVIISGENDYTLKNQKQLLKKFNKVDLHYTFNIIPGMGHEYPKDFGMKIESLLKLIL